jgi:hypothetical protein
MAINLFFTFEAEVKIKLEVMISQPKKNAYNLKTYPMHLIQIFFCFVVLPIDDTSVMGRVRVLFFPFPSCVIGKFEYEPSLAIVIKAGMVSAKPAVTLERI